MSDTSLKSNVEAGLAKAFAKQPHMLEVIKLIGKNISDTGMSIEDSCIIADFSYVELQELMKHYPVLDIYFKVHRVKYKQSLLSILHSHARQAADPKLALQLLSLGFSDEYDAQSKRANAKGKKGDNADTLTKLIKRVQKKSLGPPVNLSAGESKTKKESEKNLYDLSHLVHEQ